MLSILFPERSPWKRMRANTPRWHARSKMNSGRRVTFTLGLLASFLLLSFLSSPFLLGADHPASKLSIPRPHGDKLALRDHWALQSSAKVEAKGEVISSARYIPRG